MHHHGAGHRCRALAIAKALATPCTLIGTTIGLGEEVGAFDTLSLPDDWRNEADPASLDGPDQPLAFHYTPLGRPWLRDRMARLAAWINATDPALLVVDVSVEIALFARLLSVPTIVVRLAGDRLDPPHLEAFRSADRLLAPFPAPLEADGTPEWIRAKTIYGGFLVEPPTPVIAVPGRIAVVLGGGETAITSAAIEAAARATPDHQWHVHGPLDQATAPVANLQFHGWTHVIGDAIGVAEIVVGGAGDGLLADVAASGRPFICIPEMRPFDEQTAKARRLAALGMALVQTRWPEASSWPALLRQAATLDTAPLTALVDAHAIRRTAGAIDAIAARWSERTVGR